MVKYGDQFDSQCICGANMRSTAFDALDFSYNVVRCHSLSCDTAGCSGNIAERWGNKFEEIAQHVTAA